jgi:hypothetical protein
MKKFIFTLIFILTVSIEGYSQTVTLSPIGNTNISNIPVTVEHYVNYVPNHSISQISYSPLGTTGTAVSLGDDSNVGPFPIGFGFEFYGQTFTQFRICTNGFITFGDPSGTYSPTSFPSSAQPNGVVAGYWTDLFPSSGYFVRYRTEGTSPNRTLIVSYHVTYYSNTSSWVDLQIVLHETTNKVWTTIISQGWTTTATQGVENHTGTLAATPPNRNLSSFNGAGTTFEYTPMTAIQQWEPQGTKNTNISGQSTWSNSSNWQYRVTINTQGINHQISSNNLRYLAYRTMFPSTISSWDFYTCDCNGDGTITFQDFKLCAQSYINNTTLPKYIFSQSEKNDIDNNPSVNYFNTYSPLQTRTFQNQNIFYIMGTTIIPTNNPILTNQIE